MCLVVPLGWDGKPRLRDWLIASAHTYTDVDMIWGGLGSYGGDLP
jgi:hypothetical protein